MMSEFPALKSTMRTREQSLTFHTSNVHASAENTVFRPDTQAQKAHRTAQHRDH